MKSEGRTITRICGPITLRKSTQLCFGAYLSVLLRAVMFVRGRNKRSRDEKEEEAVTVVAEKPVIKVAAICGSLRKASYNRGLIRAGN